MVDVVVWTESEERERWWREIVGITPSGDRCAARDVGELPAWPGFRGLGKARIDYCAP